MRDGTAALGTALAGLGLDAPLVATLDKLASSTNQDTFINTHIVDVLLYRFAGLTTESVRTAVIALELAEAPALIAT